MRTISVKDILAVRDRFREPPYPGFSLDEVCRRKRQSEACRLVRGDNAWSARSAASAEEGISRKVQGELNKLAPEKYDDVCLTLKHPHFFATDHAIEIVSRLIFEKALLEPGYSECYVRLCHDLACYEVALTPSDATRKQSKFRNAIVGWAQQEFMRETADEADDEEERLGRRKKNNIKFIGHLYMKRMLSENIVGTIVRSILGRALPSFIDIEVLMELMTTIGRSLDGQEATALVDETCRRVKELSHNRHYPPRIHFKMLDLLDLRANHWEARVTRADEQDPRTLEQAARAQQAAMVRASSATVLTPTSPSPTRKTAPRFPDSPPPVAAAGTAWRSVAGPPLGKSVESASTTPATVLPPSKGSFSTVLREMFHRWVTDGVDVPVAHGTAALPPPDDASLPRDVAVVAEVVRSSCLVTRHRAQVEACEFLVRGLQIDDTSLFDGLVVVLQRAWEENIPEDTPKFHERFAKVLTLLANKSPFDLFRVATDVLLRAYDGWREDDEEAGRAEESAEEKRERFMDGVMNTWKLLPAKPFSLGGAILKAISSRGREERHHELVGLMAALLERAEKLEVGCLTHWLGHVDASLAACVRAGMSAETPPSVA